jgi:archaellum component FlaC
MLADQGEAASEIKRLQKEKNDVESRLQDATDSLRICQKGAEQTTKLSEERALRINELKAECRELRKIEESLKKELTHQRVSGPLSIDRASRLTLLALVLILTGTGNKPCC